MTDTTKFKIGPENNTFSVALRGRQDKWTPPDLSLIRYPQKGSFFPSYLHVPFLSILTSKSSLIASCELPQSIDIGIPSNETSLSIENIHVHLFI